MTMNHALARAFAVSMMLAAPLAAQGAEPPTVERIEALRAGQFVWRPEAAPEGPVEIVFGLAEQRAYVFRGGILIGASTISSGREGYETPIGRFQILEKRRHHRSNRYNSAPMPYMQRLNWYGVAIHGGEVPDRPASHGCIRLPVGFAQRLFAASEVGGFVFVTEQPLGNADEALTLARAHADAPMPASRLPGGLGNAS